jgi:Spy/CpxP family protein refolding chaperone
MFLHAAHEIPDLTDAQKASLEKFQETLHASAPGKDIKALHTAEIAGVKAGKLDVAKLKSELEAIDKAVEARHEKDIEVLNGLYKELKPEQRKALVAALKIKMAEHEKKAGEHEKKDVEEWQKKRLEHLTKELDLDAAQQKTVAGLMEKSHPTAAAMKEHHEEMKKRMEALLTAFEGEGFDAKKLEGAGPGKKLHERIEKHIEFLAKLLPVLKPPQREKLAASMEKHPAAKGDESVRHDEESPYHPLWADLPPQEEEPAGSAPVVPAK